MHKTNDCILVAPQLSPGDKKNKDTNEKPMELVGKNDSVKIIEIDQCDDSGFNDQFVNDD